MAFRHIFSTGRIAQQRDEISKKSFASMVLFPFTASKASKAGKMAIKADKASKKR